MNANAGSNPEKFVITGSGASITVRNWRPTSAPKTILAICHGLNSHSGQYDWAAEQFKAAGFSVYGIDLRGRGESSGERFYVAKIEDYVADLKAMIDFAKSRDEALPVYLLGHSAGGVVSCVYTLDNQQELAGLICESFAFKVPAPDFVLNIVKWLSSFFPRLPVLKLKNEDFSRDPEVVKRLNNDPLTLNETQPAKTVAALVRANERLKREFNQITLPVFILHGTSDKATLPEGSRFFEKAAGSKDKTIRLYQGHYHDLLADIGKEEVINDLQVWIESRLPPTE